MRLLMLRRLPSGARRRRGLRQRGLRATARAAAARARAAAARAGISYKYNVVLLSIRSTYFHLLPYTAAVRPSPPRSLKRLKTQRYMGAAGTLVSIEARSARGVAWVSHVYAYQKSTERASKSSRWWLAALEPRAVALRRPKNWLPVRCAAAEPKSHGGSGGTQAERPPISCGEEHAECLCAECLRWCRAANQQVSIKTGHVMACGGWPFSCCS